MTNVKLLIIEDDNLISRMYQEIFSFDSYEVTVASDGQAGLEAARAVKPTLIMLDIMMPKMNGLEVLDKLKTDPETKQIPVIMLTNLSGEKDAQAALSKGAIKYIVKSHYDPKQISDMVKEILTAYTRDQVPGS